MKRLISTMMYKPEDMEQYLSELVTQGWMLKWVGGNLMEFEQTVEQSAQYRVEYLRRPSDDMCDQCKVRGWQIVPGNNRELQVFRSLANPEPFAIQSDEERSIFIRRRLLRDLLICCVINVIVLIGLLKTGKISLYLPPFAWRVFLFIGVMMIITVVSIVRYVRYKLFWNCQPSANRYRRSSYQEAVWRVLAILGCIYMMVIDPIHSTWQDNMKREVSMDAFAETLQQAQVPYIRLDELTNDTVTVQANSLLYQHQPLVRATYRMYAMSDHSEEPSYLYLEYYEVRPWASIDPLAQVLLDQISDDAQMVKDIRFDTLYQQTVDGQLRLLGYHGKRIASMWYTGASPELAQVLFAERFGKTD